MILLYDRSYLNSLQALQRTLDQIYEPGEASELGSSTLDEGIFHCIARLQIGLIACVRCSDQSDADGAILAQMKVINDILVADSSCHPLLIEQSEICLKVWQEAGQGRTVDRHLVQPFLLREHAS